MKTDKQIGKRLMELRQLRNETREELAKIINVSYSTIVKYEYGFRHIPDSKKILIAKHFNLSVGEMFYEF